MKPQETTTTKAPDRASKAAPAATPSAAAGAAAGATAGAAGATAGAAGATRAVAADELLAQARAYQSENAEDGMGALAKFFFVAENYPETEAGQVARTEAEALQGKLFEVELDARNAGAAQELLGELCKKLLANPVIEDFEIVSIEESK